MVINLKVIAPVFLLLFSACSHSKYDNFLVGENGFYWDVVQDGKHQFSSPRYSYFFGKNGHCVYYAYMKYPGGPIKRVAFDYGDVIYPNTWLLRNDTLELQGFKNKIISLSQDKVILSEVNDSKDTIILIKSNFKE